MANGAGAIVTVKSASMKRKTSRYQTEKCRMPSLVSGLSVRLSQFPFHGVCATNHC
jgi:hypothetical protein